MSFVSCSTLFFARFSEVDRHLVSLQQALWV
jgi:hypothetical protein